jgi:hypothetical protein
MIDAVDLFKDEKRLNRDMDENYATTEALLVVKNQVLDTNDRLDLLLYSLMKEGYINYNPSKKKAGLVSTLDFLEEQEQKPHTVEQARGMLDKFNSKARKFDFGNRNQFRDVDISKRKKWLGNLREAIMSGPQE